MGVTAEQGGSVSFGSMKSRSKGDRFRLEERLFGSSLDQGSEKGDHQCGGGVRCFWCQFVARVSSMVDHGG